MKNIEHYRELLLEEKASLEEELKSVGHKDASGDWEGDPGALGLDIDESDENSVADKSEDFEERSGVETELEVSLKEINAAIKRTEDGTYGKCKVCGKEIEEARLIAILSADTCKEHIGQ